MFRKAQQSVAHQSKLPSGFTLGNRDLRSLQEIINSEKEFIRSNAKSAQDFHKSAEALKIWASSEGEDLQDVLGKLSLLFDTYGTAQTRLNAHLSTIRQHFKSVRTREEGLAELRSRKRSLGSKIESVEKKLAKMGPENKELMKTTAQLKDLRAEMESLRIEVQTEEAAIGDYKRRAAKEAMGIKCGGLLELAEKLTIVAETGKLMIEEISLEPTHPGMPRTDFVGAMRTDQLLQEATRSIADVGFAPSGDPTGGQRQKFTHRMRPSEMDDSMQGYYNSGNVTAERENEENGWNQEQEELTSEHANQADETYESAFDRQSLPASNSGGGYGGEYRSAPIYVQHSSSSHATQPVPAPLITQDTATDEWRRSRTAQPLATPVRDAQTGRQPASGTPIADQYASRSPEDVQVGGTGLHLIRSLSDESVERKEGRSNGFHAAVSPLPTPALPTPMAHHDSSEMYQPAPTVPMQQPGSSTPPVPRQFSTPVEYSVGDEDEQYFQSVGSTRALQQAIRRPLSPGTAMSNTASANNSITGHVAATPYEPQAEGRKMTAAAFRKGFGRVPSSQQTQHAAMDATSTTSHGLGANTAAIVPSAIGVNEAETAPLAIRKRFSAVPGQTAPGDMAPGDYPAPPYNAHRSIYGGLDNEDDMYAALPAPGPHGAAAWGSRPNSRPGSAAGYR